MTARVLFDVGHPAQVHLFRNAVAELEARGHETLVASRRKEVTVDLLDAYGIDHEVVSARRGGSPLSLLRELCVREVRLLALARSFRPDVVVSRLDSPATHVSRLVGCRCVVVEDTYVRSTPMRLALERLFLPFADVVAAPADLALPVAPGKRRDLPVQELAYLHPARFTPHPDRLREHGVPVDGTYFVVRLAGWDAYHDAGHRGLSPDAVRELVDTLAARGTVYLSSEGGLPDDLEEHRLPTPPHLVHDVLYHATLYVGDSGTMSTEAAVLGTPAIRTNTLVDDHDEGTFVALEEEYGLLQSFADERRALRAVEELLAADVDRSEWRRRRERLVADAPDVTGELVAMILDAAGETADGTSSVEASDGAGDQHRARDASNQAGESG